MTDNVTRRQTIQLLVVSTGSVAGCMAPTLPPNPQETIDLESLESILELSAGTTHTISSTDEETYDSVLWEPEATLELEVAATLELTTDAE